MTVISHPSVSIATVGVTSIENPGDTTAIGLALNDASQPAFEALVSAYLDSGYAIGYELLIPMRNDLDAALGYNRPGQVIAMQLHAAQILPGDRFVHVTGSELTVPIHLDDGLIDILCETPLIVFFVPSNCDTTCGTCSGAGFCGTKNGWLPIRPNPGGFAKTAALAAAFACP